MAHAEPTETIIREAFELITRVLGPTDAPELFAVFTDGFVAGTGAAKAITFAQIVNEIGIPLPASARLLDPESLAFAEREAARLVVQVDAATREGLARVVAEAITDLQSVPQAGRGVAAQLLAGDLERDLGRMAGLNSQRVATVLNYEDELRSLGIYSEAKIQAKLDIKAREQLGKRSRVIANTEMNFAVSEGQRIQAGRVGAGEKLWQTAGDDDVDEDICEANADQGRIPASEEFQSGHQTSPGHVGCRCAVSYVGADPAMIQALIDSGEL